MHLSVQAAYEMEFIEDEPSSEMQPVKSLTILQRIQYFGLQKILFS